MGRTGSCLDNAVAESFFAALRIEFVERLHYRTRPPRRSAGLDLPLRWESA
jgi:putative transposase